MAKAAWPPSSAAARCSACFSGGRSELMTKSLMTFDVAVKPHWTLGCPGSYRPPMKIESDNSEEANRSVDPIRRGFGMRLKAARTHAKFTQQEVADLFEVKKATVSAWEQGGGDPGVFKLRRLAKLYNVSADALLWDDSLTNDALQVAAQFDALTETQKRAFRVAWTTFVATAASDERVAETFKPVRWRAEERRHHTEPVKVERRHSDDRPPAYGDLLGGDSAFGGLGGLESDENSKKQGKRR